MPDRFGEGDFFDQPNWFFCLIGVTYALLIAFLILLFQEVGRLALSWF